MFNARGFGISARLYSLSLGLAAVLTALAGYVYLNLHAVSDAATQLEKRRVPQLAEVAAMELQLTRISLQLRHAMLARDDAERNATLKDIAEKSAKFNDLVKQYESELFTPEGKARFAKLPPLLTNFWAVAGENIALISAGKQDEAFAHLVDKTIPARNALLTVLDDTRDFQTTALTRELDDVHDRIEGTLDAQLALFAMIIVVVVAISRSIAKLLNERVRLSQTVAASVAQGDLTMSIDDSSRDEFTPLLVALREMQDKLSAVVTDVRQNADNVAVASAQIAQGNMDLSSRTEEQAGALQQTTSTMSTLGSAVRQNADNAEQANQMALNATEAAKRGGAVVSEVVVTMQEINSASTKIADIVGVIDGIAFQTNILALNAAVEAARAGEQGRGFAVVASEVRSLAQRSAKAAHEIKDLIDTSVQRVERGAALVGTAGGAMDEIVAAITKVNDIVGEITLASLEQSAGVSQVGKAISQIDGTTQQNAALVEESAAAASSLQNQADSLVRAMATFKTA